MEEEQGEIFSNDGNYCKENCRWATKKEQGRNMRSNKVIEFNNKKLCLSEWAEIIGINKSTLSARINRYKWSIEKAFT